MNITEEAEANLKEICAYIERDSPSNAQRMRERLLHAIAALDIMPYRYRRPRTGKSNSYFVRSMPVGNYLVKYRIDEAAAKVVVLRIRHGARRP